jgi:hypothetical protein
LRNVGFKNQPNPVRFSISQALAEGVLNSYPLKMNMSGFTVQAR